MNQYIMCCAYFGIFDLGIFLCVNIVFCNIEVYSIPSIIIMIFFESAISSLPIVNYCTVWGSVCCNYALLKVGIESILVVLSKVVWTRLTSNVYIAVLIKEIQSIYLLEH